MEEKSKKFKKLAENRTNYTLNMLRLLGNLSNRANYNYTEEEVNKIFSEIERKTKEVKAKFHFSKNKEFKL